MQKATVWGTIGLLLASVRLSKWDLCIELVESLIVLIDLSNKIIFFVLRFYFNRGNRFGE